VGRIFIFGFWETRDVFGIDTDIYGRLAKKGELDIGPRGELRGLVWLKD
jgi:hypothetical protein